MNGRIAPFDGAFAKYGADYERFELRFAAVPHEGAYRLLRGTSRFGISHREAPDGTPPTNRDYGRLLLGSVVMTAAEGLEFARGSVSRSIRIQAAGHEVACGPFLDPNNFPSGPVDDWPTPVGWRNRRGWPTRDYQWTVGPGQPRPADDGVAPRFS